MDNKLVVKTKTNKQPRNDETTFDEVFVGGVFLSGSFLCWFFSDARQELIREKEKKQAWHNAFINILRTADFNRQ